MHMDANTHHITFINIIGMKTVVDHEQRKTQHHEMREEKGERKQNKHSGNNLALFQVIFSLRATPFGCRRIST